MLGYKDMANLVDHYNFFSEDKKAAKIAAWKAKVYKLKTFIG